MNDIRTGSRVVMCVRSNHNSIGDARNLVSGKAMQLDNNMN